MTGIDIGGAVGAAIARTLCWLAGIIAFIAAICGFVAMRLTNKVMDKVLTPINTSLTFTQTNRLVVTHYIIIPAAPPDWSTLTSRYPANVTRTTLKFE